MVPLVEGVGWLLILLAGVGYAGIAVQTIRHEDFPGKPSFVASCLLIASLLFAITVLLIIMRLDVPVPLVAALGYVMLFVAYATGLIAPLAWVRFVLVFTGQRIPTDRRTFVRIGLPVIVALVAVGVFTAVPLLSIAFGRLVLPEGYVVLVWRGVEYVTTFTAFYLSALLVVGISLIGWTSFAYRHLSNRGGVLLGIGFAVPWIAIVIPEIAGFFEGQPVLVTYHVAVGSVIGVGSVGSAVYRHRLFGNVPAAGPVGREVTVEEMNDPVVVVDADHRLVDLNEAAERVFDTSVNSLGEPVSAILDDELVAADLFGDSHGDAELTTDRRTYEASLSQLRNEYGRLVGYSVVFHDVTERKRREQRIQVLNRVLRHNLRNDLNVVIGCAELLEERTTDPGGYTTKIQRIATDLIAIGEKAREIEEVVATHRERRMTPLSRVIHQVLEETRTAFENCTVRVDSSAGTEPVDGLVLTPVLRELLENACRHTDAEQPRVELRTRVEPSGEYPITIRVIDNGPGIPDHELIPIREGKESALEHGSGLGLWLVEWGMASLDGLIEFEDNEPRGTVVTLRLRSEA